MTERQQEQIALHALGVLTPEEVRLLESEWRYDPRLREEYLELSDAVAEMARLLPEETAPEDVRAALLKELKTRRRATAAPFTAPLRLLGSPLVAWGAAIAIAVMSAGMWTANRELKNRVDTLIQSETAAHGDAKSAQEKEQAIAAQLKTSDARVESLIAEVAQLKKGFDIARVEIAKLQASMKGYEEGEVLVVWDQDKQEGVIQLAHMPQVQGAKDYQLWVFCKQQRTPVSAGVVHVNEKGEAFIPFRPTKPVAGVQRFAMTVERQGGVPEVEGRVILASSPQP